jgi:probable rRNA maturation factor
VQYAHTPKQIPSRAQFRRWVSAALSPLAPLAGRGVGGEGGKAAVTLRLVDSEEGRALNRDYRGKDYATNVLTFAYGETEFDPEFSMSGDIVLCTPVVETEAQQQGKDLLAHYAHLTVHGMLHLQGYDHESDKEAVTMEAREAAILAKLGFSDPYAGEK